MLQRLTPFLAAGSLLAVLTSTASAALIAGDIIILGYTDNGAPDSIRIAALTTLNPGEVIYFTDNGWTAGGQFRGATSTDGDGNENLLVLTINNTVLPGTVIGSPTGTAAWTWGTSGAIPGATTGTFANLSLSTTGEQITAFQAATSLPLLNPSAMLFQVDNTGPYEDATTAATGLRPTGLTATTSVLLPTAPLTFQSGSFGLNPAASAVAALPSLSAKGGRTSRLTICSRRSRRSASPMRRDCCSGWGSAMSAR